MVKAIWNNVVIAQSDDIIEVEGYLYFPPDSVNMDYLVLSGTQSTCPWKGVAEYYDVVVDGKVSNDSAWQYPEPKEKAGHIKNYVAFWKGVDVVE